MNHTISFEQIDGHPLTRSNRFVLNTLPKSNYQRFPKTGHPKRKFYCITISASLLLVAAIWINISKVSKGYSHSISIPIEPDFRNESAFNDHDDIKATMNAYDSLAKDEAVILMHSCAQSVDAKRKRCIIFSPYADLRDHFDREEIFQRHQSLKPVISPLILRNTPIQNDRAVLTRCGYKGGDSRSQINQDRAIIISPYLVNNINFKTETDSETSSRNFIMGIFDGHGDSGQVVAQHAAQTLLKMLTDKLELLDSNNESRIKNSLVQTFVEVDATIPQASADSGSTASVILRLRSKIYVANAGDSQSFIVSYHKQTKVAKIVYITREDKPDLEGERKRIETAGGTVYIPPDLYDGETLKLSSRVLIPFSSTSQIALAMSRSIGDHRGKSLGVIAEPLVDVFDIQSLKASAVSHHYGSLLGDSNYGDNIELFAVSASDGLLDNIEPLTVARHLATSLYQVGEIRTPGILEACEKLIMQSSKMWSAGGLSYRDDISLAVSKIET